MGKHDQVIKNYIAHMAAKYQITGVLVCGSYTNGHYTNHSDLDTLFLVEGHPFEMKLERFEGVLFDRIIADSEVLEEILLSGSKIGNILSVSFGSKPLVMCDSVAIQDIIRIAKNNVEFKHLSYIRPREKPKKVVDGSVFTIDSMMEVYHLLKDGEVVI